MPDVASVHTASLTAGMSAEFIHPTGEGAESAFEKMGGLQFTHRSKTTSDGYFHHRMGSRRLSARR